MRKVKNDYLIHLIQQESDLGDWTLNLIVQEKETGDVFYIHSFEFDLQDKLIEYRVIGNEVDDKLPIPRKEQQRVFNEEEKDYISRLINATLHNKIRHQSVKYVATPKIQTLTELDNILLNEGVRNIIKQKIRDFRLYKLL
jgi:hypothetical protein